MEESGRFTAWKQPGTKWLSQTVILGIIVEKKGGMRRHCATSRKVAGSIPDGATGIFTSTWSLRLHYGPGVDSASKRNEYRQYFLGVKAAGAYGWQP